MSIDFSLLKSSETLKNLLSFFCKSFRFSALRKLFFCANVQKKTAQEVNLSCRTLRRYDIEALYGVSLDFFTISFPINFAQEF